MLKGAEGGFQLLSAPLFYYYKILNLPASMLEYTFTA
jgi:hypothetical protein